MTAEFPAHLTEEALNDVLIGMGTPASEQHLSACAECRARAGECTAGIALLDASSLAWSRQRAAQMPDTPATAGARHWPLATMGWAAAAVLLAAVALPVWHSREHPKAGTVQPAMAQAEDSEAQIAQDNALLRDVDAVVNASEAPPLGEALRPERPHRREKARPE